MEGEATLAPPMSRSLRRCAFAEPLHQGEVQGASSMYWTAAIAIGLIRQLQLTDAHHLNELVNANHLTLGTPLAAYAMTGGNKLLSHLGA